MPTVVAVRAEGRRTAGPTYGNGWNGVGGARHGQMSVALARLYRGVHHPTDIAGSVLLAVLWLTTVWLVLLRAGKSARPTGAGSPPC